LKILHITNWYPNKETPKDAIWIERHIESLSDKSEYFILHFEIIPNKPYKIIREKTKNKVQTIIQIPFVKWSILEFIYGLWLLYQIVAKRSFRRFDIINFHIAYPMLTYWHWLKCFVKKPIVISEHWSAYYFNFNVNKKLPRIQRIFAQGLPVITVSKALAQDIKVFSKANFPVFYLPNIVDDSVFYSDPSISRANFFFMVAKWKNPKNPFPVMEAFLKYNLENGEQYRLIVAGYGPLWEEMNSWILKYDLNNSIKLLGVLEQSEIADYMRRCKAFLHSSTYETFSVVCAEAVTCGAKVVASNVGGIPEAVGCCGLLIDGAYAHSWYEAFRNIPDNETKGTLNFSPTIVGNMYLDILNHIINNK
jgi:L-malate glycosyltransferase